MPIHDLGFRAWQGETTSERTRWWVVATSGIRIVWKSYWLRRMVMASWVPALLFGFTFFAYETWIENAPDVERTLEQRMTERDVGLESARDELERQKQRILRRAGMLGIFLQVLPHDESQRLREKILTEPDDRHYFWSYILQTFFRYSQGILMVLLVGMIAPPLISRDVRSKAFLLYFSRPLSLAEYVLGKMCIMWFFLAAMSTLPALCLYFLGVMLSPDFSVILDTWDLPLRILLASVVLLVPMTCLALMLSSLTSESRFASFAWFAVWVMGGVTYAVIVATELPNVWKSVFLFDALGNVQTWIFLPDLPGGQQVWAAAAILTGITVFSLLVLMRRVSAPVRV